ncbi:MAG: Wzz/FepE/Etk N-terminal domain-containing protein [Campylobacterota bacterium]|nr:Wzz/FepE/Etk N-terminal domain-containing protein [Campylobacterota bacterium]
MNNSIQDIQMNRFEEDEIDLKELFNTIWTHKNKIIIFTTIVTVFTIIYSLTLPNKYKSTIIFEQQGLESSRNISGGLSSLAGLGGISLGGSGSENIGAKIELILKDYRFNEKIVKEYNLHSLLNSESFDKEYIFTKDIRFFYDLINRRETKEDKLEDEVIKDTVKLLTKNIIGFNISKKEGFFNLSAEHYNKKFTKKVVDIYLKELVSELKQRDMQTLEKQLRFYNEELSKTSELELKTQISSQVSSLLKKKVLSNVNELYMFDVIVQSREPFIDEKSGPKRALIVVVSFVTSIILGIFGVFFREMLNSKDSEER